MQQNICSIRINQIIEEYLLFILEILCLIYSAKYASYTHFYFHTAYIPAKNMVFSDITSESFKVSWSPAGPEVLSYLIKYKVAVGGDEFIVSVPASSTSSVLTNLLPETTYAVSVISEYEDGDGPPLDGEETTLEGRIPIILRHKAFTCSNKNLLSCRTGK